MPRVYAHDMTLFEDTEILLQERDTDKNHRNDMDQL